MSIYVGHKKINKFMLDGNIHDESDIPRMKAQYISLLEHYMRSRGYLRIFDIDPVFTIDYNEKNFYFIMTIYGCYVGKAKSKCYDGISANKLIPLSSTQKIRSNQSSILAE